VRLAFSRHKVGFGVTGRTCRKYTVATYHKSKGDGKRPEREPRSRPSSEKKAKLPPGGKAGARSEATKRVPTRKPGHVHTLRDPLWVRAKSHLDVLRSSLEGKYGKKRLLTVSDEGEVEEDPVASALAASSSLFVSPSSTYLFRLVFSGTISQVSTAQTKIYLTWNPSADTEYNSYLVNLFQEVRIRRSKLRITPDNHNNDPACTWVVAPQLIYTATAPTSVGAIADATGSEMIYTQPYSGNTFDWDYHVPSDYNWCNVSTPVIDINRGAYGQWSIIQTAVASNSSIALNYFMENFYEFRSRD